LSEKEAAEALALSYNILEFEIKVQPICRKASAEIFCVWRQIINIKTVANQEHNTFAEHSASTVEAIDLSMTAVRKFSETFEPFIIHCVINFARLSTCPRISLGKQILPIAMSLDSFVEILAY
jgi:hypothetical protein